MKNLMKSKVAMSLLLIGLAAIIIGGATMAWFTAEDTVESATFTAGTVIVNADGEPDIKTPDGKYFDNVNPGDCARVTWNIVNEGTKAVELRVKLSESWEGVGNDTQSTENPFYWCPPADSDWVMVEEDTDDDGEDETWLYYTGGPVPGTYGDATQEQRTVPLTLVVGFDGEQMDNDYQGASVTLGGGDSVVEAVQASNDAPLSVWGEIWNTVTNPDYDFTDLRGANYFYEGLGSDMPCWGGEDNGGEEPGDDEDYDVTASVVVTGGGNVTGAGTYAEGATVVLTASANSGYKHDGWTVLSGGVSDSDSNPNTFTFVMPANDVSIQANFSLIQAPPEKHKLQVTIQKHSKQGGGQHDGGNAWIAATNGKPKAGWYYKDEVVTLVADPDKDHDFWKWTTEDSDVALSTSETFNYTMPDNNVTLRAWFKDEPKK